MYTETAQNACSLFVLSESGCHGSTMREEPMLDILVNFKVNEKGKKGSLNVLQAGNKKLFLYETKQRVFHLLPI